MIVGSAKSVASQLIGNHLGALAAAHIHDSRPRHRFHDVHEFVHFLGGVAHYIGDIAPHKTLLEHISCPELEFLLDVVDHNTRGCGCQCQHGSAGKHFAQLADLEERGSEIISPLRYTVRLVNDNEAHVKTFYPVDERVALQALGRHIEELVLAIGALFHYPAMLSHGETAMQIGCLDATFNEIVNLVFHQ